MMLCFNLTSPYNWLMTIFTTNYNKLTTLIKDSLVKFVRSLLKVITNVISIDAANLEEQNHQGRFTCVFLMLFYKFNIKNNFLIILFNLKNNNTFSLIIYLSEYIINKIYK